MNQQEKLDLLRYKYDSVVEYDGKLFVYERKSPPTDDNNQIDFYRKALDKEKQA
jgi:hypothetical protein